jgi:phospholipid transport system substrate-binding protein
MMSPPQQLRRRYTVFTRDFGLLRPGHAPGLSVLLAGLLVVAAAGSALAGPPTEQVKGHADRLIGILEDPKLAANGKGGERREAVRQMGDDAFDWQESARRALGRHWRPLSEAERRQFVGLFRDLIERAYLGKIDLYKGERVRYVSETIDGDFASVMTRIITKQRATEIPVEYRLVRRGDRWLIYDLLVEGISLISNYRSQFAAIIQKSSYEQLVKELQAKQAEGPSANGASETATGASPRR